MVPVKESIEEDKIKAIHLKNILLGGIVTSGNPNSISGNV